MKPLKAEFECEVITPMFIGGADPAEDPEIRPPAIKAQLRYWYRAKTGEGDIKKLLTDESEIFGSSSNKSKVKIRVINHDVIEKYIGKNAKTNYNLEARYDRESKRNLGKHEGIAYLFYNCFIDKKFIKDGFKFKIILQSEKRESLLTAIDCLWLSSYLGGLGSRSRRGCGCFRIIEEVKSEELYREERKSPQFISKVDEPEKFEDNLFDQIGAVLNQSSTTKYSTLADSNILVIPQKFSNWVDAVNFIGKIYAEYRYHIKTNHFKGPNFGLPIMHGNNMRIVGEDSREKYERRSSPVLFKVWRSGTKYFAGLIRLNGDFLPNRGRLLKEIKSGVNWKPDGNEAINPKVINDFFDIVHSSV